MAQSSPSNSTMGHCQQQEMRWTHSWLGPMSRVPRRCIAAFCLRKHFPLKTLDEFAEIIVVFLGPILLESSAPYDFYLCSCWMWHFRVTGIGWILLAVSFAFQKRDCSLVAAFGHEMLEPS